MAADLKYRADIDGLRTLAVVPVVLFHAGLPFVRGGFVGVDIFFVISGFLITGILLGSIERGNFSIAEFYRRRIRRIFPALLLVVAATTIAAWVFLTPERIVEYGRSLGFVSIFGSNVYFWKSVDYFSTKAHVQPLLHTWSLAVEEQFYIFYPLLLWGLAKAKLKIVPTLIVLAVLSLLLSQFMLDRAPSAVFYLLPTRAWELLIGGLLACGFPATSSNARINLAAASVGLALLVFSIVFYSPETPFPGVAAMAPTLGSALLIWSGTSHQGPIHKLLSTRFFVSIGRASYSFYLWHFPIFAFAAYLLGGTFNVWVGLGLSVVALLAAFATLRWVETPVRQSKSPYAVSLPLGGMVLAGLGGLLLASSDGYPRRLPDDARRIAQTPDDKRLHHDECMSVGSTIVPPSKACHLGVLTSKPRAFLWGDSHAMVTATAMEKAATAAGQSFLFAATADCPIGLGFSISPTTEPDLTTTPSYRYCGTYNHAMFDRIVKDRDMSAVVLSARWTNWRVGAPANPVETDVDIRLTDGPKVAGSGAENAAIFEAGFVKLVAALVQSGKKVYIVGPVPEPSYDVPQTLFVARFGLLETPAPIPMAEYSRRHRHILELFKRVENRYSVDFIWPHKMLCVDDKCPIIEGGRPVYFDHNHLSMFAARKTAPLYAPVFGDDLENVRRPAQ